MSSEFPTTEEFVRALTNAQKMLARYDEQIGLLMDKDGKTLYGKAKELRKLNRERDEALNLVDQALGNMVSRWSVSSGRNDGGY